LRVGRQRDQQAGAKVPWKGSERYGVSHANQDS
jgi:hypothetical protein